MAKTKHPKASPLESGGNASDTGSGGTSGSAGAAEVRTGPTPPIEKETEQSRRNGGAVSVPDDGEGTMRQQAAEQLEKMGRIDPDPTSTKR